MKSMSLILILVIIGLLAGIFSGLLGVGGGVIMIPMMVFALGFTQHEAQGTSLAVLAVPVTLIAAYNYYEAGHVNWKYAAVIAVTFVVGAYFGSKFAVSIDQALLKKIFGIVLIIVALRLIFWK
ncbi:MAG: sulfite exporter TauE/SafE family protein [Flavobacteriaceae bacterium]|nr:sulfite exporter TauE/SafE family protein [Flavobacteriaceae bacterium]